MNSLMIKICGICDSMTATQAARLGANFIGIVLHSDSPRFVTINQAVNISKAASASGATPVAVFVNQSADEMYRICQAAQIRTIQLHGSVARAQHHLLPAEYQRIYVESVSPEGVILQDKGLEYLDKDRDLILIDHVESGKGKSFEWSALKYDLHFRWLLAGGLSPRNVNLAISELKPDGIDISSGVEIELGKKDYSLIESFIKTARGLINDV